MSIIIIVATIKSLGKILSATFYHNVRRYFIKKAIQTEFVPVYTLIAILSLHYACQEF